MKDRSCGIIIRNGKIFFIEQWYGKDDLRHMFVGGGVEENETPEQAVIRELNEEANINGEILFGPVTVAGKRRTEHMYIIKIPDSAEPSPGYDPEMPLDNQDITNVLWYDIDTDIDKFNDIDIEYFSIILADAENYKIDSDWVMTLKKVFSNYRSK